MSWRSPCLAWETTKLIIIAHRSVVGFLYCWSLPVYLTVVWKTISMTFHSCWSWASSEEKRYMSGLLAIYHRCNIVRRGGRWSFCFYPVSPAQLGPKEPLGFRCDGRDFQGCGSVSNNHLGLLETSKGETPRFHELSEFCLFQMALWG